MGRSKRWLEFERHVLAPDPMDLYNGFPCDILDELNSAERDEASGIILERLAASGEWSIAFEFLLESVLHLKLKPAIPHLRTLLGTQVAGDNQTRNAMLMGVLFQLTREPELESGLQAIAMDPGLESESRNWAIRLLDAVTSDETLRICNELRCEPEVAMAASGQYHLAIEKDPSRALPLPGEEEPSAPMTKIPLPGPAPIVRKAPWWKFWKKWD